MTVTRRVILIMVVVTTTGAVASVLWYFNTVPSISQLSGQPGSQQAQLEWYVRKAEQWQLQSRILRTGQVTLTASAIIASVLAASSWKPATARNSFLAAVAAVSISLLTGLDLTAQANKIRNAERHLTFSILDHKRTGDTSLEEVIKAYQEAEELVGDYNPQVGVK